MTTPVQIPDAAVQALEALKKAEIFIENGVEYGFIRLPEKPDPALDTLPKIKAAIEALTNDGAKPVDVAAVWRQAFEADIDSAIEKLLDIQQDINFEANSRMSQSLCDASAYIDKHEAFLRRIRALSAEPAQGAQVHKMYSALVTIASLIGNADHSEGNGVNSATARGEMLNDIRGIASGALPAAPTPEAEA